MKRSGNFERYFDENGEVKRTLLKENRWLEYLTETDNVYVNAERVECISGISGKETLMYVLRTLDIFDETATEKLDEKDKFIVSTVLKWSEVSKGGLSIQRQEWLKKGYPLSIHNIASAEIIYDEVSNKESETYISFKKTFPEKTDEYIEITRLLIKTHGLIGQCIRGEIPVSDNASLVELTKSGIKDVYSLLLILNECIIRGVSDKIWADVKDEVSALLDRILHEDISEYSAAYRLEKLCPKEMDIFDEDAYFFAKEVFPFYELWYFSSALSDFDLTQIREIIGGVLKKIRAFEAEKKDVEQGVKHINFKPLADNLYYDYESKKHINVYRKRIIEKYIRDSSVENVELDVQISNKTAFVDFKFSKVCEKLIDFCVEAERSGLLTFEKSIVVLYDMFGFRRDAFDRLNNEEKYLGTMNDVVTSTKESIIDFLTGQRIVDVGSGGGILLDRLEKKYPDKKIIGTDISANVIETLNLKKSREGHKWDVCVQNFVDGPFKEEVDSVIFSSILHEIYSYTEGENGLFDIESVKKALKNSFDSLRTGGRIIIRDGIKTEGNALRTIKFKTPAGMDFFKNYFKDFKGLKELTDEEKVTAIDEENLSVTGDINFIREFMYTYTWGSESYAHEVKEQFGYFTLSEY
ncbi:MAG: methyltransferase domain-containing protein, partial [Lachnospiraceae bacterium]|nr:methyltransferase domain-containing protein [Lachnospiraceae bacterium]